MPWQNNKYYTWQWTYWYCITSSRRANAVMYNLILTHQLSLAVWVLLLSRTVSVPLLLIVINSSHTLFIRPVTVDNGCPYARLTTHWTLKTLANWPKTRVFKNLGSIPSKESTVTLLNMCFSNLKFGNANYHSLFGSPLALLSLSGVHTQQNIQNKT